MGIFYPRAVAIEAYPFRLVNKSTGAVITSGTPTVTISKDGVQAAATNTPVYNGNGEWLLDITSSERDCNRTTLLIDHTDAVPLTIVITSDQENGPGAKRVLLDFGSLGKNASVWVTYTSDDSTVVASGDTDSNGQLIFYLDNDSYNLRFQKAGVNFTNPYTLVVTTDTTVSLGSNLSVPTGALSLSAYADISTAQAYFDTRLNTTAWDEANSTDRNKALLMATRAINRLDFAGRRTTAAAALGNQFPRGDDTAVPDEIVYATCEEALSLLGTTIEQQDASLYILEEQFSGAKVKYNSDRTPEHTLSGITSPEAWRYLVMYLRENKSIEITRV